MKSKLMILVCSFFFIAFSTSVFAQKQSNLKTTLFNVSMDCESCKAKIEKNIAFEKGVKDMQVDLAAKTVSVTYDSRKSSDDKLVTAFKKLGYVAMAVPTGCGAKSDENGQGQCKKPCGASECKKPCAGAAAKSCCDEKKHE